MSGQFGHVEAEILQSFLDGELEEGRRGEVETHLQGCARCAAEVEGWRLLFEELRELPVLTPSSAFRGRILGRLPAGPARPEALRSRIRRLLPLGRRAGGSHLTPARAQDFLEGLLPARALGRVEAHLASCAECEREVASWSGLFQKLSALPSSRPSAAFRERVMGELRERSLPAARPAGSWLDRLRGAAAVVVPSTRRGRVFATGVVAAPALGLVALVAAVMAHPLLSPLDLLAFLSWRASDLVQAGFGRVVQSASGSATLLELGSVFQSLVASPGTAAALLGAAWLTTIAAAWILYRNVFAPLLQANRHVRASS